MIRYNNNVYPGYNIDPTTGQITDPNGNTLHQWLHKGYWMVSVCGTKMPVHRIQAHTHFGFNSSVEIHHKDFSRTNNALDNLCELSAGDHRRVHHVGKHVSKETCAKISSSKIGTQAHNKGVPMSEEQKAKLRGRKCSEETKQKLRELRLGKKLSDETKQKLRERFAGENNPNFGKKMTEEQRAKLSIAHLGRVMTPEARAKIGNASRGRKFSEEHRRKLSESLKAAHARKRNNTEYQ